MDFVVQGLMCRVSVGLSGQCTLSGGSLHSYHVTCGVNLRIVRVKTRFWSER